MTDQLIGINCGSGQRPFTTVDGVIRWINVDAVVHDGMPLPDLVCDGAHLPYEDGSVDYFVLHHVLEHFGCGEGVSLLREAHRVLSKNGTLLVFVPNLRALATGWLENRIDTQVYVTNLYGAYMGNEADRHRWGFDTQSLGEQIMSSAPWGAIDRYRPRYIPGADIAWDWWILGMEATK